MLLDFNLDSLLPNFRYFQRAMAALGNGNQESKININASTVLK
jgi:hypothetical protein